MLGTGWFHRRAGGMLVWWGLVVLGAGEGWAQGPGELVVEINNPQDGDVLWNFMCQVGFTVQNHCHPIQQCWMDITNGTFDPDDRAINHDPPVGTFPHSDAIGFSPSSEVPNGAQTITVRVTCSEGCTATDQVNVTVDVKLLYRVNREDHEGGSTLMVKCWRPPDPNNPQDEGDWMPGGPSYTSGTRGSPHNDCAAHGPHDDARYHRYCVDGHHPPRGPFSPTKPKPSNTQSVSGSAEWASSGGSGTDTDTCPTCGQTVRYFTTPEGGSMGLVKIPLPSKTAPCGCSRGTGERLLIHGGGGSVPDPALRHGQGILSTRGCLRMHNGEHRNPNWSELYQLAKKHDKWLNLGKEIHILGRSFPG